MGKIVLTGSLRVPPAELASVRAALPRHIELSREEAGCLIFRVDEDPGEPGLFMVHEEFEDAESFELHQQRVRSSDWGAVSASAERDYEIKRSERRRP